MATRASYREVDANEAREGESEEGESWGDHLVAEVDVPAVAAFFNVVGGLMAFPEVPGGFYTQSWVRGRGFGCRFNFLRCHADLPLLPKETTKAKIHPNQAKKLDL